jgi:hypothetical protein
VTLKAETRPRRECSGNKNEYIRAIIDGDVCVSAYGTRGVDNKMATWKDLLLSA